MMESKIQENTGHEISNDNLPGQVVELSVQTSTPSNAYIDIKRHRSFEVGQLPISELYNVSCVRQTAPPLMTSEGSIKTGRSETVPTDIVSVEVNRLCGASSTANNVEIDISRSTTATAPCPSQVVISTPSVSSAKPVVLSDQFTAILVKPESLLFGMEIPIDKNNPTGASEAKDKPEVSGSWFLPSNQLQQMQFQQPSQKDDSTTLTANTDFASATPDNPYMFGIKDHYFSCEFCPNIRFTRSQLRRHKAVHTGQRNYACNDCGKRFAWKHSLQKHSVLHSGQCPFTCNQCGKGFSAAQHLQHHMRMHDPGRQYHCTKCDKNFARSDALVVHSRLHSGQETFPCTVCTKSFTTKFGLNTHMRAHGSGEGSQFICTLCDKTFSRHSDFVNHNKQVHEKVIFKIEELAK